MRLDLHGLNDDIAMKFTGGKQVMQTQKIKVLGFFFPFLIKIIIGVFLGRIS